MRNPLHSPFVTVFQNELLLNSKRVAPYALMILFTANAVLWWIRPAVTFGWATNSDWYIVRCLLGFSFLLGLPIFNAVIIGDSVIRDFRLEVDPLIFSKPVNRTQYLLGKFFGNFFVLVCCTAVFPITQLVLQAFPTSQMIVLQFRVFPYFKHFLFFLVLTHLLLAAVYFTLGTLTRSSKIVYAAAVCFYPLFISYGVFVLKHLPPHWQTMLDPMQLGATLKGNGFLHTAEFLNQYVVRYSAEMIANRLLMIGGAAACLLIVYLRFSTIERTRNPSAFSVIDLASPSESISTDPCSQYIIASASDHQTSEIRATTHHLPLPGVVRENTGPGASLRKFRAATGIELQLLKAERSLLVLVPLALLLSFLSLPRSAGALLVSVSAGFASASANGTLLFLLGVIVFYSGEAMHRDRELRIEPVLWSTPARNSVFLMSKLLAIVLLATGLLFLIGFTAMLTQLLRGRLPIEVIAYLRTYAVIAVPGLVFIGALSLALNVLLRDKYLTYAAIVGTGSGLFYLYTQGHNHWLYNPLLIHLWDDSSLVGPNLIWILKHRLYVIAMSAFFILLAHLAHPRRSFRR